MIAKLVKIVKKNAKAEFCENMAEDHFDDAGAGGQEGASMASIQASLDLGNFWAERAKQERNRE